MEENHLRLTTIDYYWAITALQWQISSSHSTVTAAPGSGCQGPEMRKNDHQHTTINNITDLLSVWKRRLCYRCKDGIVHKTVFFVLGAFAWQSAADICSHATLLLSVR